MKSKNPWISIWTSPRPTIQTIVKTNPRKGFFFLAALYSLQSLLFIANFLSIGVSYHFASIVVTSVVLSPIMGTIWIYIYGWLFHITGRWFGGNAPMLHIRAAFAWSKVPLLVNLLLWVILLIYEAETTFIKSSHTFTLVLINVISTITGIWSFFLLLECIREVQKFTFSKALWNVITGYLISFVIIFVFSFIIYKIV